MPLYQYGCEKCGVAKEVIRPIVHEPPICCGEVMTRSYCMDSMVLKMGYPGWINRIDEIHKRQADRGERLRLPHPKEVGAT